MRREVASKEIATGTTISICPLNINLYYTIQRVVGHAHSKYPTLSAGRSASVRSGLPAI